MKLRRNPVLALVASVTLLALASCGKSTSITAAHNSLDPTPPSAPSSLSSDYVQAVGYDYLYWNLSSSPSAAGYEVWESSTMGGTATKIGFVSNSDNFVVLPTVNADCTRYYEVRTVSTQGLYSAFSAAVAVDRHVIVSVGGSNGAGNGGGIGYRLDN